MLIGKNFSNLNKININFKGKKEIIGVPCVCGSANSLSVDDIVFIMQKLKGAKPGAEFIIKDNYEIEKKIAPPDDSFYLPMKEYIGDISLPEGSSLLINIPDGDRTTIDKTASGKVEKIDKSKARDAINHGNFSIFA